MSDSPSITSSGNSWTVLTPEVKSQESAVESIGPGSGSAAVTAASSAAVTDGLVGGATELSKEPTVSICSEEGLQVCQETTPDSGEGSSPPSPAVLSPSPSSHTPLITDHASYATPGPECDANTLTSFDPDAHSPPDSHTDTYADTYTDSYSSQSSIPVPDEDGEEPPHTEQLKLAKKVAEVGKKAVRLVDELVSDVFLVWRRRLAGLRVSAGGQDDTELGQGDRLRKRKVHALGPLDTDKQGDEEEEEEEYTPRRREEEGGSLSLNKCILGALILLALGTLLFSGVFVDLEDEEGVEVRELKESEVPVTQEWGSPDPDAHHAQETEELLDKLAQENQQITVLQSELQTQKEELNLALQRAEEGGKELQMENERMRSEMSTLPDLQRELESLRARVTELTHITASSPVNEDSLHGPTSASPPQQPDNASKNVASEMPPVETEEKRDKLAVELGRQKVLLEESRKRLEEMKVEGGGRKHVRNGLAEMEKRLMEEVEKLERRGEEGRRKREEKMEVEAEWGGWRKKEERKGRREWREGAGGNGKNWKGHDKEWKKGEESKRWEMMKEGRSGEGHQGWRHEGEGGKHHHGKEKVKEWLRGGETQAEKIGEWKNLKEEHHKGEGEQKERGRKERHWQSSADKTPLKESHRHHDHNQYWKRKREKLQHFYRPSGPCSNVAQCAQSQGLVPVLHSEFVPLLETYLDKIEDTEVRSKEEIRSLVNDFFTGGVFSHDKISFGDFVEDLADILEDMVEGEESEEREDEMEEFEREALSKFRLPGVEEKKKNGRVRG